MSYSLPSTLNEDIKQFAKLAEEYKSKKIDAAQFKAFRVPMGIYEQRQDEVYMSRVRTTGGVITPLQFLNVIEIAKNHKSNLLHITTRQEIQIQNLALDEVESIMQDLSKIELATKGGGGNTIRNIMVSEWSGISFSENFDTTSHAMAITSKLLAEPDSYLMPRKMKIAFASDDNNVDYAAINDLGLVATIKDGKKGFLIYAGGGAGAKPTVGWVLFDFIPESELYVVAGALKKFFSEHGNRKNRSKARLRFVFYKLGEEETLRLIREYYQQAQKEQPLYTAEKNKNERPSFNYNPGKLNIDNKKYNTWKNRYVKSQPQQGYSTILLPILLGNISLIDSKKVEGLKQLLSFIKQFGENTIRFTTTQNIRLRNIPDVALPDLFEIIAQFIPEYSAPVLINNITSCTGADTCRLGIGLSKGLAKAIRDKLLSENLDLDKVKDIRIQISGCPNSCGQQLWADIGFSGKILRNDRVYPGYQVYLGAHRDTNPHFAKGIGNLSSKNIPTFVYRLLKNYLESSKTYPSFTDYLENEGTDIANQLIEEYKEIPSFTDDKNYYFDWGAETVFSVIGRGKAECAAGLFDMLEIDHNIIKTTKEELLAEKDLQKKNSLLYDIIFSASRMLLITRGAEPKTTSDVFDLFIKHFIEYGFVDEKYRELIITARDNNKTDFVSRQTEIYELTDKINDLYQSLDDTLQFKNTTNKVVESNKVEKPETKANKEEQQSTRFKDLRGVACPMNFVQTKIQLASMQSGDKLEILLDDGQPISNVPGSVRNEGHEVLEQSPIENYWKVIIRKK